MAAPATTHPDLISQRLGHYRVLERIGAGGMGEIYRGFDEHLNREVAIKILPAGMLGDEQVRSRFREEALALSSLNHPNIATVYDFDARGAVDFLVTEFVPGASLDELLLRGALGEAEILLFGRQLAEALVAAHASGIIHRDIKPANLRITPDRRLKVLDFGLSARLPAADTVTADSITSIFGVSGTLAYMPPEQLRGEAPDVRSDIYSAGAVLYEMACGRPPFTQALATALIDAVLHSPPVPPRRIAAELSPRLEDMILKCLEKNAAFRYQSAVELLTDFRRSSAQPTQPERSIAVLYFDDLTGQAEDTYFRDGITEDITTELSRIKGLRVFSRAAVLPFRDRPITHAEVGRQLAAGYVVAGSVRRDRDHLRITAQLVDTATGHCSWAERYDRSMQDVFAIQDEIAHSIAAALRVVLSEEEKKAIGKLPTADVRAYDFYLRGRQFFHQFRRKGLDFAREMFGRAIELDPSYARAYAGIADCSAFLYMYWDSSETNLQQADEASRRALELDPDLAEAHTSRGLTAMLQKNYEIARQEFDVAIALQPSLYEPYYFCARSYYAQGKYEDAAAWFQKSSRVFPEDYQSPMLMASALNGLGRKSEARAAYRVGLAAARQHLELHPGDARALYFGANALSQLEERGRSLQWLSRALEVEPDEPQVLYNVACVYALLGEPEKAIDCLQRSVTRGWGQKEWMAHDPDLASLRSHARFQALVGAPR